MKTIYSVYEENEDGSFVINFFNNRREDAINYLQQQASIFKSINRDWKEEKGINCYKWSKDGKWLKIYLNMIEIEL